MHKYDFFFSFSFFFFENYRGNCFIKISFWKRTAYLLGKLNLTQTFSCKFGWHSRLLVNLAKLCRTASLQDTSNQFLLRKIWENTRKHFLCSHLLDTRRKLNIPDFIWTYYKHSIYILCQGSSFFLFMDQHVTKMIRLTL